MLNKTALLLLAALISWAPLSMAEVESWYTYWAIGASDNSYSDELDESLDNLESIQGVDRTEVAMDLLGIYFPLSNQRTIVGGVINASGDRIGDGSTWMQLNRSMISVSAMHFMGAEPGDGFFIRGDLGLAKMSIETSEGSSADSDRGTGVLFGLGYGLPLSDQSRLILGANFTTANIEEDTVSALMFTVGGLW